MTRRELAAIVLGAASLGASAASARKKDEAAFDEAAVAMFAPSPAGFQVLVVSREVRGFIADYSAPGVDWCSPGTMLCGRGYDLVVMTTPMDREAERVWYDTALRTRLYPKGSVIWA
jgi:hypothetical protein